MIRSVTVTNHLGESLQMNLAKPSNGIALVGVDGLGPVNSNINITEVSTNHGGLFNSSRKTTRNMVFAILLTGVDIEACRHFVYRYFPVGKKCSFLLETDTRSVRTTGYVEKNEVPIFTKGEYCQISVICESSFFYDANDAPVVDFSSTISTFTFPFGETIPFEFGHITANVSKVLTYKGDVDAGMIFTISVVGAVVNPIGNITIANIKTAESLTILTDKITALTGAPLRNGDTITINTTKGSKKVELFRDGTTYNILNAFDRKSVWMQLVFGDNEFDVSIPESAGIENIRVRISHNTWYEGV